MSGVRFVSIVFAIAASFLWGGFVVNSWQKNQSTRDANINDSALKEKSVASARETALNRADELALAASKEYEKLSNDLPTPPDQLPSASSLLKVAENAKMADVVAPNKVAEVEKPGNAEKKVALWSVPTGADPIVVPARDKSVGEKISTIATKVKDEAAEAVETVGSKISSIATKVKDNLSGDEERVAGATDEAVKSTADANKKLAWRVPDANSPDYDIEQIVAERGTIKVEARVSDEVKPGDEQPTLIEKKRVAIAEVSQKIMNEVVDERALLEAEEAKQKGDARLGSDGNQAITMVKGEHDVSRDKLENKDDARLSKDLKAVDVAKYKYTVPEGVTPVYDESKVVEVLRKPNAVWSVPTGATPEYNVGVQIERGLDSVAEVAAEAGAEIVEKVVAIGDNVKGAIASPPRWVVPTGVTPGDDGAVKSEKVIEVAAKTEEPAQEKVPAKVEADASDKAAADKSKDNKAEKAKVVESEVKVAVLDADKKSVERAAGIALPEKMKFTNKKEPVSGNGDEKPREVVVSAKMEDFNKVEVVSEKDAAAKEAEKGAVKKAEEKAVGLVNRIINMLSTDKDADKAKDNNEELYQATRVDKVRFEAIKNLMVDAVDYKFTDIKKGEGRLVVNGRAQPDALLSLYLGPRYLGDVVADKSGTWVYTKELYIPRDKHIIQAQQMSDGGVSLARKSYKFVQDIAAKPPKDYVAGVGIDLGDKALATLRKKLKKSDGKSSDKSDVSEPEMVDTPLPVLKGEEVALADTAAMQKQQAAKIAKAEAAAKAAKEKADAEKKKLAEKAAKASADKEAKLASAAKEKAAKEKAKAEADKVALLTKAKPAPDDKAKLAEINKNEAAKVTDAAEPVSKEQYYIVKAGDSLGKIAKRTLGSANKYKDILLLNPQLKSAHLIYPSQKLLISKADGKAGVKVAAVAKKTDEKVMSDLPSKKGVEKKAEAPKSPAVASTYIVKRGDSLWIIAKKVYGNGAEYRKLIKLNPQLAKNPGSISPNMKLQVNS